MANCDDLSIREISGGTVYLQGTITGLDSNKEYCLKYYEGGGIWRNVLNRSYDYTYVPNRTSLNTGSIDCCIPESAYTDAGKYYVAMYEVVGRCENVVGQVCDKYIALEEIQCLVDVRVIDQSGNSVMDLTVNIAGAEGADNIAVDRWGIATGFTLIVGRIYTAKIVSAPSGYRLTSDSSTSITAMGNQTFTLSLIREDVECTTGDTQKRTCEDGTVITTHNCIDGKWVSTSEICPITEPMGKIVNVNAPEKARKGDEVSVTCMVKNDGYHTGEYRVCLYNPEDKKIDCEPDVLYKSLSVGEEAEIIVSTHWDPEWAMPGYDWNLTVKLWEVDLVGGDDLADEKSFTVKLDEAMEEGGKFVSVSTTNQAHKGDEVSVTCIIKNTGTKTSEYRVYLKNPEGRTIDKEPDTLGKSVAPGAQTEITVSTHWDPEWAMPGYDWNLKVELWEMDLDLGHDLLDTESFTVTYVPDDELIIETDLLIDVPSLVMAGIIEVSGTGPANERVYIMGEKKWLGFDYLATDTELADTVIGEDGTYSAGIELDEFGSVQIYAKVKKGGFWDWIVADLYSKKHTVWVLTWTVVVAMLLAIGLILEKKYNKLGIFRGGK